MIDKYQIDARWYRPGCGFFNQRMIDQVHQEECQLVIGDSYPHDPQIPFWWINYWYLRWKIEPNSIIILHDLARTIPLLKQLIPVLKEQGYQFVTLSEGFDLK